jgi:hypothetical protein
LSPGRSVLRPTVVEKPSKTCCCSAA